MKKKMLLIILILLFWTSLFYYGWFIHPKPPETYSKGIETSFNKPNNLDGWTERDFGIIKIYRRETKILNTHAFNLNFLPACTPFGGNATCGYDLLLIIPLAFSFLFIALIVVEGVIK